MNISKLTKTVVKQVNLYTSSAAMVNPVQIKNPQMFQKLKNQFFTYFYYSLVKNIFTGFDEHEFLENSVNKFNELNKLVALENKSRLIVTTSQPLTDFLTACSEKKYSLPFDLNKKYQRAEIISVGKFLKDNERPDSSAKWYQIGLLLKGVEAGKEIQQYIVLERRELDSKEGHDWKIAHIDGGSE